MGRGMVVTYSPARSPARKRSELAHSGEAQLLDLLRKAETNAYALAHGCDVSGYADRAHRLIRLAERLGDAVVQVDELVQSVESCSKASVRGLKWRAHSLRRPLIESTRAPFPDRLMRSTLKRCRPSRRSSRSSDGLSPYPIRLPIKLDTTLCSHARRQPRHLKRR
jgi:hypothetical protein